jgi:hypothetical protein
MCHNGCQHCTVGGDDSAPAHAAGASVAKHRSCTCSRPASPDGCFQQPGAATRHRHPGAAPTYHMQPPCSSSPRCQHVAIVAVTDTLCDVHAQVQMASRTPGAFNAPGSVPGGADAICTVPYSAWDLEAPRNGASVSRVSTSLWQIE